MSTKIYNGYRLNKKISLPKLQKQLLACRQSLLEMAETEWHSTYAAKYLNTLDSCHANDDDQQPVVDQIDQCIEKSLDQIRKGYRSPFDLNAEISVKQYHGRFYFGLFTENKKLKDVIVEQLNLSEYYYWNNTDQPDDISDKEWDNRSKTWDVLLNNGSWTDSGFFSFELVPATVINKWIQYSDISALLSDRQSRSALWVKRKVIESLIESRITEQLGESGLTENDQVRPSNYMRIQMDVINEVKEGQHLEVFNHWQTLFDKMAPEINLDNFRTLCQWN